MVRNVQDVLFLARNNSVIPLREKKTVNLPHAEQDERGDDDSDEKASRCEGKSSSSGAIAYKSMDENTN